MNWSTLLYVLIALLALALIYWLVRLIWFRPLNIQHLYARTFLTFAFRSPELLTMLGMLERLKINFHNARLADASEARADKEYAFVRRALETLRSYPRQRQKPETLLSTDILDWFLDDQVRAERFRHHDYPLNQMFGLQSEFPNFMTTLHPVDGLTNARNYIKRLSKVGIKFDQALEGLRIREQKGCLPPRFVIRRVLDEMRAFIAVPAQENVLYTVYADKLAKLKLKSERQQQLLVAVAQQVETTVYPAYGRLIAYFNQLEDRATDDDGIWKLPDGDAYYAHQLRSSTSTELTPAEVHEIGLQEVARIEAEMGAILEQLGYPGDHVAGQMQAFAQEERFLFPNDAEGRAAALAEYERILVEIDQRLAPLFDLRPKARLKVERIPEFREQTSAGAYYMPGSLDGSRPGVFYANLRDMKEVHKFGMKTLAYHEGIPGHHFQLAIAQELRGLPFFRRMVPFTAYAEGWALYAEKLAREQGAYQDDPYGELGYLDSELFRAVRLVVDTGIHHKRWTRQQAIDYMMAHVGQAEESIISEVERYIVMPGQACAYKVGEIKIVNLRAKAMAALGEHFDMRQFHNVLLGNGAMPLDLLEQRVEAYIAGVSGKA
ncbi:MAG: DUF885 domain-containing protein [Anaerolineales bacterium]|nr:DUF885 domain-containing protein [Anaerolineales bacterium]